MPDPVTPRPEALPDLAQTSDERISAFLHAELFGLVPATVVYQASPLPYGAVLTPDRLEDELMEKVTRTKYAPSDWETVLSLDPWSDHALGGFISAERVIKTVGQRLFSTRKRFADALREHARTGEGEYVMWPDALFYLADRWPRVVVESAVSALWPSASPESRSILQPETDHA